MFSRCPGANSMLQPIPEEVRCPHCHLVVEMFTNESVLRCYHCGEMVHRERRPSCFDWCEYADLCMEESGLRREY